MLMEMVARKSLAIGRFRLEPGDVVSDEVSGLLPPGRVKVLKDQGWLSERPVNASNQSGGSWESLLAEQQAQIDSLMERVAQLEARRGPGRPRKAE